MQTEEFQNADHASQETLIAAVRQMEQSLGGADKVSFKKLGTEVAAYQNSLLKLKTAQAEYADTYTVLIAAQQKYIQAQQSGTEEEKEAARQALETAQANANAAAENVQAMQGVASEAQRVMSDTAVTLKSSMDGVVNGLRQIASGSLSGAYEGLMTLGNSAEKIGGKLGKAFGKVADTLEDVPIIGWIVSIVDVFKDGLSVVVSGLLDAVFNAVSGILSDVLSGDLFVSIGKSIIDGVGGIFDAITFGGLSSWFSSSNGKEVQETIDRLTNRNEALQTAIEDLTDEIKSSKGTKSVAAYRDAYKYQQETNANYLQMAQAQAGYHGSHHSWNYYWGGFSQGQIDRLSTQIGRQWNGDLWNLTPEEMKLLRSNVDMWSQIQNTGKGGYGGRLTDKLNDYIDQAGKLEEMTNQLYEGLTGISFDSMYSSFIDQLMDMEASAEDFADNVSEYFMRAMLSNKIGEMYADKLEEWWKKFGKAMEDNDLTEAERNALQEEYMNYVEEAMKLRDQLAAATGYGEDEDGTSQSAKACGWYTNYANPVTGITAFLGAADTVNKEGNSSGAWYEQGGVLMQLASVRCMGYENWYNGYHEWVGKADLPNTPAEDAGKYRIFMPDGTVRKAYSDSYQHGSFVRQVRHQRYMDTISVGDWAGAGGSTYYSDHQDRGVAEDKPIIRSHAPGFSAGGGVTSMNSEILRTYKSDYCTSRLAFRGTIREAGSVEAYKALQAIC